jgi:hypothetical protein
MRRCCTVHARANLDGDDLRRQMSAVRPEPSAPTPDARRPYVLRAGDALSTPDAPQFCVPATPLSLSEIPGGFSMICENRTTVTSSSIATLRP